jgi:branched-chain amino acid transport system permease protein
MLTILIDGLAAGSLFFVMAVGLSVTLGLMNFVNLAHGAFAMAGGYVTVLLMQRVGIPYLVCLPLSFLAAAALGALLEILLYRRLYAAPHLDQVLFSVGLIFMAVAGTHFLVGSQQQIITLPAFLRQRYQFPGFEAGAFQVFLIVTGGLIALLLHLGLTRTRFGAQLRAAVDNPAVARGLGLPVGRLFAITFMLGSGLAGLGGALAVNSLGLDPGFPLKYLVYFLIVVAVGGTGTITGPLAAALLLGVADIAGKYYLPQIGAFVIYAVMVGVLLLRPRGLFGKAGR